MGTAPTTNKRTRLMEIKVKGTNVNGDDCDCLGSQLADLIERIAPALPGVIWLSADVDTTRGVISPFSDDLECIEIGPSEVLIALSRTVHQYLQGVFIAVKPEDVDAIRGQETHTEFMNHKSFKQSILEIRAFDTSYFSIYIRRKDVAELLIENFQAEIGPRDSENPFQDT